jgi:hypothetical protein
VELISVSPYTVHDCDVVLFSLYWWQHFYDYVKFLLQAGITPGTDRRPLCIVGGFSSYSIQALGDAYHWGCIGDGEAFVPAALQLAAQGRDDRIGELPGAYWPGKREPTRWQDVPFDAHQMVEPGQQVTRIEIARGCRYSCRFCALSYLKSYREGQPETVTDYIDQAQTKSVALFAPDRTSHSHFEAIQAHLAASNLHDLASDTRLDTLMEQGGASTHIRFGLEGCSERLRRAVGKAYSAAMFLDSIAAILDQAPNRKRGVRFYLILDLPGETEDDYAAFAALIQAVTAIPKVQGLTLMPIPNVFLPSPLTPLQYGGINVMTDFRTRFRQLVYPPTKDGMPYIWPFQMAYNARIFGPLERLKSMIVTRCDEERTLPVLRNIVGNPGLKKLLRRGSLPGAEVLLRFAEREGLSESYLCGEQAPDTVFPWSSFVTARTERSPHMLPRAWNQYRRIAGMPPASAARST